MKENFIFRLISKKSESKDPLLPILMPSVLAIVLCAVCLLGTTFAWFSATKTTAAQTITAANYTADVMITEVMEPALAAETETATTQTYLLPDDNGEYTLEAGKTYSVSITAGGTATEGYFIVKYADQSLHTVQVENGDTFTFTLTVYEATTLKITPQWGASTKLENEKLKEGDTKIYGTPPICFCIVECAESKSNSDCKVCKTDIVICKGTAAEAIAIDEGTTIPDVAESGAEAETES